jgi:hypothetical protein
MWFLLVLPLFATAVVGDEASCSALAGNSGSLGLNGTVLTNSTWIPAGAKNVSGTFNTAAFCEVTGKVSYPTNNYVIFEAWLPEETSYNGRFLAVGKSQPHHLFRQKLTVFQEMVAWQAQLTKLRSWKT